LKALALTIVSLMFVAGNALAADGFLKVNANPGRAGVFVNGKYLGPSKNFGSIRKYTLPEGEHELRLSEPRYEDIVTKVKITAGKVTQVAETMKAVPLVGPPFGRLRIQGGTKYDAVYLNNRFYGHVDEFDNFAQGILLPPGEYLLRVEPLGGAKSEQKVAITANQNTNIKLK